MLAALALGEALVVLAVLGARMAGPAVRELAVGITRGLVDTHAVLRHIERAELDPVGRAAASAALLVGAVAGLVLTVGALS